MKKMVFERATPESQGIDSSLLLRTLQAAQAGALRGIELHDFLLLRHGKLVFEGYFAPYSARTKHTLFSQTKSFMATAVGLAIYADGLLKPEDEAIRFFPEVDPAPLSERAKKIRVCDLLSMSSGHGEDTTDVVVGQGVQAYFELPLPYEPGTHFLYNTGNSILLAMIVERLTGKSLYAYLKERIFDKIGIEIEDGDWERVCGACGGGYGLHATAMDVLRLANLYLLGGKWEGEQLIPAQWVEKVSRPRISNGDPKQTPTPSWSSGYSYQFWMCDYADAYRIDGAGGQQAAIVPSQDMVILFNSALHGPLSDAAQVLARYYVMPAVSPERLPENPEAQEALLLEAERMEHPARGRFACPPVGTEKHFSAESGPLRGLSLRQEEGVCAITLRTEEGEETVRVGLGGKPALSAVSAPSGRKEIVGRGFWVGNRLRARLTEFPSIATIWLDLDETAEGLQADFRFEWGKPILPDGTVCLKRD